MIALAVKAETVADDAVSVVKKPPELESVEEPLKVKLPVIATDDAEIVKGEPPTIELAVRTEIVAADDVKVDIVEVEAVNVVKKPPEAERMPEPLSETLPVMVTEDAEISRGEPPTIELAVKTEIVEVEAVNVVKKPAEAEMVPEPLSEILPVIVTDEAEISRGEPPTIELAFTVRKCPTVPLTPNEADICPVALNLLPSKVRADSPLIVVELTDVKILLLPEFEYNVTAGEPKATPSAKNADAEIGAELDKTTDAVIEEPETINLCWPLVFSATRSVSKSI